MSNDCVRYKFDSVATARACEKTLSRLALEQCTCTTNLGTSEDESDPASSDLESEHDDERTSFF